MAELKPCPFCGRKADLIQTKCLTNGYVLYHVFHYDLKCPTNGIRTENRQTQEEAIEAWNRRAGYIAIEDIVDLDSQTAANNEAMRKVIAFMAGGTEDGK